MASGVIKMNSTPVGLTLLCTVYTITFLKLWSYVHVNYWCRLVRSKSQHRRRAFSVAHPCTSPGASPTYYHWKPVITQSKFIVDYVSRSS